MSNNETPCWLSGDKARGRVGQEICSQTKKSKGTTACGECTNFYFRNVVSTSELG